MMNVDTFQPHTVNSRPLVPLPAEYLPEFDVLGQEKLPSKYQSYYLPDAFPAAGSHSLAAFNGHSSSFPGLQNLKGPYAVHDWSSAKYMQINPYSTPVFSRPLSNTCTIPPTVYGRMATPASRQRTTQACNNCRERKTKCSGKHPVCQRCSTRGLDCRYTSASNRDTRLQNTSRGRHHSSHEFSLCRRSPEVDDRMDRKGSLVRATPAILAPRPIRPSMPIPVPSDSPGAAFLHRSIQLEEPTGYHVVHLECPNGARSALGLTGVFTKPTSTITSSFTPRDLTPRATKDNTPMTITMFTPHVATPSTSYRPGHRDYEGQANSFHDQTMSSTDSRYLSDFCHIKASPARLSIPFDQYAVPAEEQMTRQMVAADSADCSPTTSSSSRSPSSVNSTASSVKSNAPSELNTLKTSDRATNVGQSECLSGEDFSFMTDPAYYAYFVESTMVDGNPGKSDRQNTTGVAQSLQLQL